MCGGGGRRATITEPDYRGYNQMADAQFKAMERAQSTKLLKSQGQLNQALAAETAVNEALRDVKVQEASQISAEAARVAALIGTPPPSKVASAPVLGSSRSSVPGGGRGRRSLRVGALPDINTIKSTGA